MISKPIQDISAADLKRLIEDGVSERKTLDYKRDLPGSSRAERIEFLADVSSFANTEGGDLIFGIDAPPGGVPVAIPGLKIDDVEGVKLALESRIRDGVSRRVPAVEVRDIPLDGVVVALIIRVPRSWIGPHRVVLEGHGHFYGRNSSGKYRLDVEELQTAFTLTETLTERVRGFRADRIIAIKAGDTPQSLDEGRKLVIHLVPMSAFSAVSRRDLGDELGRFVQNHLVAYKPLGNPMSWNHRVNLDGRVVFILTGLGEPSGRSYTQLFRSGVVEAVRTLPAVIEHNHAHILCREWTRELREFLRSQLLMLRQMGIERPVYLFISLTDVKDCFLSDEFSRSLSSRSIPRSDLLLSEVTIESATVDVDAVIIPVLTRIWNAAGEERCPHFDQDGKWMGP